MASAMLVDMRGSRSGMSAELLLASIPVLLVGAVLASGCAPNRGPIAASMSQGVATVLVLISIVPVLSGAGSIEVSWPWPAPIERIAFRVDALGAFFLAWSLPMTLLGTVYAVRLSPAVLSRRAATAGRTSRCST